MYPGVPTTRPVPGEGGVARLGRRLLVGFAGEEAGESEVGEEGPALLGEEHVLGVHVAMQDLFGVGSVEGPRQVFPVAEEVGQGQGSRGVYLTAQAASGHVGHGDPGHAVRLQHLVDGHDVGMADWEAARASRRKRTRCSGSRRSRGIGRLRAASRSR